MNIGVVGAGYVGLTTGICLSSLDHKITIFDLDEKKLNKISERKLPFFEKGLGEILEHVVDKKNLIPQNSMNELVKNSYYKTKDDHFSVYLLPDHNYVGQTQNVADRKRKHRNYHNRNVDNIQILHKFNTREEALAKEAEYHNMGYAGAK